MVSMVLMSEDCEVRSALSLNRYSVPTDFLRSSIEIIKSEKGTMDEDCDEGDSKRRTRNLSEKRRRDQFNLLVNELGSMVSTNNRKMDKSTVLKSTITFLKNHNEVIVRSRAHDVQEDWKPGFLSNEEFTYLVLEALEGFVMVFSATGHIYYVSDSVTSLLGHNASELVNKSIFDFTFEDDRCNLYGLLQNPTTAIHPSQPLNSDNEIQFQCHLRRGILDFRDEITYELIQFNGHFRTNMEPDENGDMTYPQEDSGLLFVCTGRLCTPQLLRDVSLVDSIRNEFISRHSLEWKFLFLDHRAPPIIGYLPFEVLGTSGYDYYHFDDLEKVISCHETLMRNGELTSCYYRFLTKGQQWIWLQTRYYITYHQWNSKPEFIVCTHRVVNYYDANKSTNLGSVDPLVCGPAPKRTVMKRNSSEDAMVTMSPSYMPEASDAFGNSYQSFTQPPSVKSTSTSVGSTATVVTAGPSTTAAASWPTMTSAIRYAAGSDTASMSDESRSSQRHNPQEVHGVPEPSILPQHSMGAQYLDPEPYVGTVGVPEIVPLSMSHHVPVIVTDQTQMQEQLQRTHRELQQMIARHQEELRQVKEQLLLARLGILHPNVNVQDPYAHPEEMQPNQSLSSQILYEATPPYPPHTQAPSTEHHHMPPQ